MAFNRSRVNDMGAQYTLRSQPSRFSERRRPPNARLRQFETISSAYADRRPSVRRQIIPWCRPMDGDHQQELAHDAAPGLAARSITLRGALARYFQRRLPGANDIEDLVQDVFLRIVKRGDNADLDRYEGYVFETAASVLKDRYRRRKVRAADRHLPFDPDLHAQTSLDPERTVLGQEALRSMTRVILQMPERTRTIFVLRRLEGLPHQEIARRLGLSLSAVEKHIQRAARHILSSGEGS